MQEPIRDDEAREISLGPDPLSAALRSDLRDRVERIIREELWAALGAEPYERTPERRGYLHSPRERTLTTAEGTVAITVPRGRLFKPEGGSEEWQSQPLERRPDEHSGDGSLARPPAHRRRPGGGRHPLPMVRGSVLPGSHLGPVQL